MNISTAASELPAFGAFIGQLADRGEQMTAEEAAQAFRRYQQQLAKVKGELQPAIDELNAGGGAELDLPSLWTSVKQQLADEGIGG